MTRVWPGGRLSTSRVLRTVEPVGRFPGLVNGVSQAPPLTAAHGFASRGSSRTRSATTLRQRSVPGASQASASAGPARSAPSARRSPPAERTLRLPLSDEPTTSAPTGCPWSPGRRPGAGPPASDACARRGPTRPLGMAATTFAACTAASRRGSPDGRDAGPSPAMPAAQHLRGAAPRIFRPTYEGCRGMPRALPRRRAASALPRRCWRRARPGSSCRVATCSGHLPRRRG